MCVKKVLSLLCGLALMLPLGQTVFQVHAQSATTYTIADLNGKITTQGRVHRTAEKLYLDWSASGVEFTANCAGDVYVTFEVESVNKNYQTGGAFFTVIVDGVTKKRDFCRLRTEGTHKVKIASYLPAGEHHFEIYRQNEIGDSVAVTAVTLSGTPKKVADRELYVEFVGDSITVGHGNLATSAVTAESGLAIYTDATQGYAYLTAHDHLKADFSTIGISGIGTAVGWTTYNMQEVYPKLRYSKDSKTDYEFSRRPDLIVLALGTNDIARYMAVGKQIQDVKQGFTDMLALLQKKNPGVPILWIHGMMVNGASWLIEEVVEEAGGAEKGVYELAFMQYNSGGNGHPNAQEHALIAEELATYIQGLFPPKVVTTMTTTTTTTTTTANTQQPTGTTTVVQAGQSTTSSTAAVTTNETTDTTTVDAVTGTSTTTTTETEPTQGKPNDPNKFPWVPIAIGGVVFAAAVGGFLMLRKRKTT